MAKKKSSQQRQPCIVEHVDSDDDEEIDEDEAFNSEDERRYGSFFVNKNSSAKNDQDDETDEDEDSVDIANEDDDEEEGDGGQYMLDLLNKLDSSNETTRRADTNIFASHLTESEYSSSVVKQDSALTMDALMNDLQDTQGFGKMQSTMNLLSKGKTTSTPVSKVVSDRAQRKVHYEESTEQVTQWIQAVQENRQAETLDFRPKGMNVLTKHALVDKFKPITDFEKELAAALTEAGQHDEATMLKAEQKMMDDLGNNELTLEAYKQRRGELAKLRALMFYHEQKRHHMNKIKSKKYRRIRKKQRERIKDGELVVDLQDDPTLQQELDEKEEIERMRERASLAHKNTSKWAKRILKRGKHVDQDTRRALSAQLKRGDDLRSKMNGTSGVDEDNDDNEDLMETARKVLQDIEGKSDAFQQNNGLFALSFMQKGVEKQRQRAQEEARTLLQELQANEQAEGDHVQNDEKQTLKKKKKKASSATELQQVIGDGKLVASSLAFGYSNSISVSGGINIDLGVGQIGKSAVSSLKSLAGEQTNTFEVAMDVKDGNNLLSKATNDHNRNALKSSSSSTTYGFNKMEKHESNPWLIATIDASTTTNEAGKSKKRKTAGVSKRGVVDVEGAADLITELPQKNVSKRPLLEITATTTNISSLTQEELVRRAFAAPTDAEVEDEFAKEKAEAIDRDDPTRKVKDEPKTTNGWGSWAGQGAPAPKPPRKLPKKMQAPEKKLPKRKRADVKKPLVILNEKRIKKTSGSFQIANIPYPYTSREEYERAMSGGVGNEWNVTSAVKNMTRPEIITRAGKVIQPISKRVKAPRPAAKF
jgi:U3 small nucleolar RNA-associated protein 14